MKSFIAMVALFAVALAADPSQPQVTVRPFFHQLPRHPAFRPFARSNYFATTPTPAYAIRPTIYSPPGSDVVVLRETLHNNDGVNGYQYSYELSDGTAREETGQVEARGVEDAVLRVRGSFQFVAQDGQTYSVTYVADENGFQPQAVHLPVSSTLH